MARIASEVLVERLSQWGVDTVYGSRLPTFADRSLQRWFARRPPGGDGRRGEVLLWPDTFTNHFDPSIGQAAVRLLEDAGHRVRMPARPVCCGLTWISTGQLATARRVLRRTLKVLAPQLRDGTPLVVLEPSCAAVFRNDARDLFPGDRDVQRLLGQTRTLAEQLTAAPDWTPPRVGGGAVVQTHCHQHAVLGFDADTELMRRAGIDADVLDSGCCGLAGNFGFEQGHYEVSMACAERVLLPAVRERAQGTAVLADGFSCRTQLRQSDAGARPVHLAELLAQGLP